MASNTLISQNPTQNAKLGKSAKMYATYRPVTKTVENGIATDGTCPNDCPFLTKCYANFSYTNIIQRKALERCDSLVDRFKSLPLKSTIRHLVSGDFGMGKKLDDYLPDAIKAHKLRPDILGFGYTHHWRNFKAKKFNKLKNLVINASCETSAEVKTALAAGWPAVQVVPMDTPDIVKSPDYTLVVCPAQTRKLTCEECMLCARGNRKAVIGFRAHGVNKKSIQLMVEAI